jgi:hypothetical protein
VAGEALGATGLRASVSQYTFQWYQEEIHTCRYGDLKYEYFFLNRANPKFSKNYILLKVFIKYITVNSGNFFYLKRYVHTAESDVIYVYSILLQVYYHRQPKLPTFSLTQ